jgi:hypothetical protein
LLSFPHTLAGFEPGSYVPQANATTVAQHRSGKRHETKVMLGGSRVTKIAQNVAQPIFVKNNTKPIQRKKWIPKMVR